MTKEVYYAKGSREGKVTPKKVAMVEYAKCHPAKCDARVRLVLLAWLAVLITAATPPVTTNISYAGEKNYPLKTAH